MTKIFVCIDRQVGRVEFNPVWPLIMQELLLKGIGYRYKFDGSAIKHTVNFVNQAQRKGLT